MKKFVLTGGPGIGKTTAIEILASRGYEVVPESSRMIMEEDVVRGGNILPRTNLEAFQKKVAEKQVELESNIKSNLAFLDRGLVDGYAYCLLGEVSVPEIITSKGAGRYAKVFILEPLSLYENDEFRPENEEEAAKIHKAIQEAYEHFGYELITIPILSPEERVEMILEEIKS